MTEDVIVRDRRLLDLGLKELGLLFSDGQKSALLIYAQEFRKWNKIHNLSAIDEGDEFISLHLLDSLAVVRPLLAAQTKYGMPQGPVITDLGAGGGLPGVPLAIALPQWKFVLVEAVKKKAAFLQHIKGRLKLDNLDVVAQRIELFSMAKPNFADATISRAFTELKNFVEFSAPLLKSDGLVFAMKSQKAEEEISGLPPGWHVIGNDALNIPNLDAFRCLLTLQSVRK